MPRFLIVVAFVLCIFDLSTQARAQDAVPGHYLFAWTGDPEGKGDDFLAVIDADPASPTYGHLVTTVVTDQKTM